MLVKIVDNTCTLFASAGASAKTVRALSAGDYLELGNPVQKNGSSWFPSTLPSGERGFISASTTVIRYRKTAVAQQSIVAFETPSTSSLPVVELNKSKVVYLGNTITLDGISWVSVRTTDGRDGFVLGTAQFADLTALESARATGVRNMLVGAAWCIGGIVVTAVTYNTASSSGGTYFIAWGPMLFGGIQCVRGLVETLGAG